MILAKAKRDELLGPLSAVSGIIERRHTLPILSNVLIERSGDALGFLATDIEIQIAARSAIAAAGEARAVTVGARKLLDILRALPDGAEVTLQQQDKRLLVKAGKSRFALQTLAAEDFPRLAKPAGEAAQVQARAEGAAPPAFAGAVRHGAAGHPLLPERPADGGGGRQPEAGRDRRPSPGVRRAQARRRAAAPGSDRAAQDGARARPSCSPTATTR